MHAPRGRRVDGSAYAQYIGRWSGLFVPALVAAAEIKRGNRVLDVVTGTGEAAQLALSHIGDSGLVVGSDISPAMLDEARSRLSSARFLSVVSDGGHVFAIRVRGPVGDERRNVDWEWPGGRPANCNEA
jgi:SAM-dependent methyltransferase